MNAKQTNTNEIGALALDALESSHPVAVNISGKINKHE